MHVLVHARVTLRDHDQSTVPTHAPRRTPTPAAPSCRLADADLCFFFCFFFFWLLAAAGAARAHTAAGAAREALADT